MEYTIEVAKELQSKHGIPDATIRVWAHRGKIPAKYFKEGFVRRERAPSGDLTPEQKDDLKSLLRAIRSPKINISELERIAGMEQFKLKDLMRGKTSLSPDEFLKLKRKFNTMRFEVKKVLSELEKKRVPDPGSENIFRAFIDNRCFFSNPIFDRNRFVYNKIRGWYDQRRSTFPVEVLPEIKGALMVLIAEMSL